MTTITPELERELARSGPRPHRAPAPERTLEQRMTALRSANRIRTIRGRLKRDLKAGRVTLLEVLGGVDDGSTPDLETMKVFDLLLAAPKCGRVKANGVLQTARISPSKTLGGLTRRQRSELAAALWTYPSLRR